MGQALKTAQTVTEEETLAAIDRSIECLIRCEHPKRQLLLAVMSEDEESHHLRLACNAQLIMETVASLLSALKADQPLIYLKLLLNITQQLDSSNGSED